MIALSSFTISGLVVAVLALGVLLVPVFFVVITRKRPVSPVPGDMQAGVAVARPE